MRIFCRNTRQREPVLRRLRETPLGFGLRVILNEFHSNLVSYLIFYLIYIVHFQYTVQLYSYVTRVYLVFV